MFTAPGAHVRERQTDRQADRETETDRQTEKEVRAQFRTERTVPSRPVPATRLLVTADLPRLRSRDLWRHAGHGQSMKCVHSKGGERVRRAEKTPETRGGGRGKSGGRGANSSAWGYPCTAKAWLAPVVAL